MTLQPAPPPGWYSNAQGHLQWWDGQDWGPLAPMPASAPIGGKQTGIAYLFLLLLGGFAAHRFYLGNIGSAFVFMLLWWGGLILNSASPVISANGMNYQPVGVIGIVAILASVVWWFIDFCTLPGLVRDANERAR